jgi:hypothetical protein
MRKLHYRYEDLLTSMNMKLAKFKNMILNVYIYRFWIITLKQLELVKFHAMFLYFQFIKFSLRI